MNDEVNPADLPLLLRGSVQPGGYLTSNVANWLLYAAADYIESKLADEARTHDAPSAPPAAQAVDLEQFRRPLKVARSAMEWARNEDAVGECDRLLALIDQHAGSPKTVKPKLDTPQQAIDLDAVRECLGKIADLSTALRHGGPAPEDLHGLSDALEEAISIAYDMCKIIDQQAGKAGGCVMALTKGQLERIVSAGVGDAMEMNKLIYQTRHRMMNGEWSIWHDAQDEAAMNRVVALLGERGIECESRAEPPAEPMN